MAQVRSVAELCGEHPEVCDRRHRERETPAPGAVRRRRPHRDGSPEEHQAAGPREGARAGAVAEDGVVAGGGPGGHIGRPRIADRLQVVAQLLVEERGGDEVAVAPGARGVPGHVSRMPQRTPSRTGAGEQNGPGVPPTQRPPARVCGRRARGAVSWLNTSEWGVSRHRHSVSHDIGIAGVASVGHVEATSGHHRGPCRHLPVGGGPHLRGLPGLDQPTDGPPPRRGRGRVRAQVPAAVDVPGGHRSCRGRPGPATTQGTGRAPAWTPARTASAGT